MVENVLFIIHAKLSMLHGKIEIAHIHIHIYTYTYTYICSGLDSASDVTPTDHWLNIWCIWHTYLETLQELLPVAEEPLLNIINSSLSLCHVPKLFQLVVIKPLIKKPQLDPSELANYRPISKLLFMSKILEKVVSAQLCSFLQKDYIYEEFQSVPFRELELRHHALGTPCAWPALNLLCNLTNGRARRHRWVTSETRKHKSTCGKAGDSLLSFRTVLSVCLVYSVCLLHFSRNT